VTNIFSIIYQTRDFGSGQIQSMDNFLVRRDLQKLRHTLLCTVTAFWLKYQDRDRMLASGNVYSLNRRAVSKNAAQKNWPRAVARQISNNNKILCFLF
jgi:hypothetical protein